MRYTIVNYMKYVILAILAFIALLIWNAFIGGKPFG